VSNGGSTHQDDEGGDEQNGGLFRFRPESSVGRRGHEEGQQAEHGGLKRIKNRLEHEPKPRSLGQEIAAQSRRTAHFKKSYDEHEQKSHHGDDAELPVAFFLLDLLQVNPEQVAAPQDKGEHGDDVEIHREVFVQGAEGGMGDEHGHNQGRSHDKSDDDRDSSAHILLPILKSKGNQPNDEIAGFGDGRAAGEHAQCFKGHSQADEHQGDNLARIRPLEASQRAGFL